MSKWKSRGNELSVHEPGDRGDRLDKVLWSGVLAGTVVFTISVLSDEAQRVWSALLVNWVFWSGLAFSGILFRALLLATNARWANELHTVADGLAAFIPTSGFLLLIMLLGRHELFDWIEHSVPGKEAWLNEPFLVTRSIFGFTVLTASGLGLLRASAILERLTNPHEQESVPIRPFSYWLARGEPKSVEAAKRQVAILSPLFIFLYGIVFSLIGFDFVMSLDPHWISTLFGAYFSVGNVYLGLGAIGVLAFLSHPARSSGSSSHSPSHDLGKLIFGFCILWTYLFWCQYLPIWYANLPEETPFLVLRLYESPWSKLSLAVLLCNFLIPFPLLLFEKTKRSPRSLAIVSAVICTGMWLERYVLIVPSVQPQKATPFGLIELSMLAGTASLFTLCYRYHQRRAACALETS